MRLPVSDPAHDERRIIASRACDELRPGAIANLGIGMPEGIARIAAERGILDRITLTVESGPIGGMPAGGLSFGAAVHPQAIVDQPAQFDFYDGGGLDFAALGAAQIDRHGNVNVSRLEVAIENGGLRIIREGANRKFVNEVEQVSFSGKTARDRRHDVLFVTERAVFRLVDDGIELIEVAPGINVETQILAHLDFQPVIREIKPMSVHLFQ